MDRNSKNIKVGKLSQRNFDVSHKQQSSQNRIQSQNQQINETLYHSSILQQNKSSLDIDDNNDNKINSQLSRSLILSDIKTDIISTSINKISSHYQNKKILIQQLNNQKNKLSQDYQYLRNKFQIIQNQKYILVNQVGELRNQVNRLKAIIFTDQDKIYNLQHANEKIVDQLNFEKEFCADYKQENVVFRTQIKNITNAYISLKQYLFVHKQKEIGDMKGLLNTKINQLKIEMIKLKDELKQIRQQQQNIIQHKEQCKQIIQQYKAKIQKLQQKLVQKKQQPNEKILKKYSQLYQNQERQYKNIIKNNQQNIILLNQQIINLKKSIAQLNKQIKNYHLSGQCVLSSNHTDVTYMNKVIKDNDRAIKQLKDLIQLKDVEISRLKETIQIKQTNSNSKTQEIQRLIVQLKVLQNNKFNGLNGQIEDLKTQKVRLTRKIDQLNQAQQSLKTQIANKDKIILNYVQKSKIKA